MKKSVITVTLASMLLLSGKALTAAAKDEIHPVSPALEIIAESVELVKTGIIGSDIVFSENDFILASGAEGMKTVTFVSLPDILSGKLMLGDREVMKNETVKAEDLSKLKFVSSFDYPTEASFRIKINDYSGDEMSCLVYTLDEINYAPVTGKAAGVTGEAVETYKNITVFDTMKVLDPENDSVTYEITEQPKKGIVTVTNRKSGAYTYTPIANYTGSDSFTYVATDKYGNVSKPAKVSIEIEKPKNDVVFTDLLGHWAHNAAIEVSTAGIMGANNIGGKLYFNPDEPMTRSEFLSMAMICAGIEADKTSTVTVFADDAEIPSKHKAYISTAYEMGIIKGSTDGNVITFSPDATITRAECAVILNNILDLSQPVITPDFEDSEAVPSWAESALYSLSSASILSGTGGGLISPNSLITRAQGAQIFSSILKILK